MKHVVVISYRRFGTTYRSYPQASRIHKKTCSPNAEFIYGRVLAVKSLCSAASRSRVVASGWLERSVTGPCTVGGRRAMEGDRMSGFEVTWISGRNVECVSLLKGLYYTWFKDSFAKQLRTALFWATHECYSCVDSKFCCGCYLWLRKEECHN
jgi:hypothetical protein